MSLATRRVASPRVPGATHTSPESPMPQDADVLLDHGVDRGDGRLSADFIEFSDSSAAPSSRPSGVKSASKRTQAFDESGPAAGVVPIGGNFFMSQLRLKAPRAHNGPPASSVQRTTSADSHTATSPSTSAPRPSDSPAVHSLSSSPGLPQESSSAWSSASCAADNGDGIVQQIPTPAPLKRQISPQQRSNPPSLTNAGSVDGAEPTAAALSVRSTRSLPPLSQTRGTASASLTSRGISPPMPNDDDAYFQPFTASMWSDAGFENPQSHSPSPCTRLLRASLTETREATAVEDEDDVYWEDPDDDVVMRASTTSASATQALADQLPSESDDGDCLAPASQEKAAEDDTADAAHDGTAVVPERDALSSTANTVTNRYEVEGEEPIPDNLPVVNHLIDLNEDDMGGEETAGDDDTEASDTSSSAFSQDGADDEFADGWRQPAPRNIDVSQASDSEEVRDCSAQDAESSAPSADVLPEIPSLPPPLPRTQPPAAPRTATLPVVSKDTADLLPAPSDTYHRGSIRQGPQGVPLFSSGTPTGSESTPTTKGTVSPPPPAADHRVDTIAPSAREAPNTRTPVHTPHTSRELLVPDGSSDVLRKYPKYFGLPAGSVAPNTVSTPPSRALIHPDYPCLGRPPAADQCEDCARCRYCDHSMCPEFGGVIHPANPRLDAPPSSAPMSPRFVAYLEPAHRPDRQAAPAWDAQPETAADLCTREGYPAYPGDGAEGGAPPNDVTRTNPWEDVGRPRPSRHPKHREVWQPAAQDGQLSWSATPVPQPLAPAADAAVLEDDTAPELEVLRRGTYPEPMVMRPAKCVPTDRAGTSAAPPAGRDAAGDRGGFDGTMRHQGQGGDTYPSRPSHCQDRSRAHRYNPYLYHAELDDSEPSPEEAPIPTPHASVSQSLPNLDPYGHSASRPMQSTRNTASAPSGSRDSRTPSRGPWQASEAASPVPVQPPRGPPGSARNHTHLEDTQDAHAPVVDRTLPLGGDTPAQTAYPLEHADTTGGIVPRRDSNELPACVGPVDRVSWGPSVEGGADARVPRMTPRAESRASTVSGTTTSGRRSRMGGAWSGCEPGAWDARTRPSAPPTDAGYQTAGAGVLPNSRRSVGPYILGSATPTTYVVYRGQTPSAPATTGVMMPITVRAASLEAASAILSEDPDEEVWRQIIRKMELEKARVHTESRLRRNGRLSS